MEAESRKKNSEKSEEKYPPISLQLKSQRATVKYLNGREKLRRGWKFRLGMNLMELNFELFQIFSQL